MCGGRSSTMRYRPINININPKMIGGAKFDRRCDYATTFITFIPRLHYDCVAIDTDPLPLQLHCRYDVHDPTTIVSI